MDWIIEVFLGDSYRVWMTVSFISIGLVVLSRYLFMVQSTSKFINILEQSKEYVGNIDSKTAFIEEKLRDSNYIHSSLRTSWNSYYTDFQQTTDGFTLDPYDYYREEKFVHKYGWRKFVEVIPAIFVSIGILGTFLGLIDGMKDIDNTGDASGMMEGVQTLLGGMSFAFYSSIAGIIFSIVFQLIDRTILYNLLTGSLLNLRKAFDEALPVKTEGNILYDLAQSQEEQMNDFKTFFSDVLIPQLTSGISEGMSTIMKETLNPHLERSNEIMEEVVKNTTERQNEKMSEMVDSFIQSLHEVSGDHMKNLGEALHKTVEWQEKVHKEMGTLVDEMKDVAEKQSEMARNTMDLSEQMNAYTSTLSEYQDGMVDLTKELNEITENNTELLGEMKQLSESVNNQHQDSEDRLQGQMEQLTILMSNITAHGSTFTDLQSETNKTAEALTRSYTQLEEHAETNRLLNNSLIDQHEKSNEWSEKTQQLLEDVVENMQVNEQVQHQMNDMFDRITSEREKVESMKEEQLNLMRQSITDLKEYWKENEYLLSENKEQFAAVNDTLSQSMDEFADHMQKGVQRTFKQFDNELENALKHLSKGVNGIQQVVELMERDIHSVNGNISNFNESISQIAATKQ
ncbi:MotA/TolQ/ExbB proton channel family protein [Halobacillus salinus]|uniref:MotA/TolQ/ExbB proton channel domain-containing protein n=1 Tax=Halobacillus salinus TaxID=192814 RepID=A0A4Z0H0K3_9BACI|nr:MotA/TolQ/ExbB proton channel family protein [Halobacillus salinus]TGB03499.1 hypothetical protein E4663_00380 [Halobacillus salinus]